MLTKKSTLERLERRINELEREVRTLRQGARIFTPAGCISPAHAIGLIMEHLGVELDSQPAETLIAKKKPNK